jgi:hypothetical protein
MFQFAISNHLPGYEVNRRLSMDLFRRESNFGQI